MEGEQDSRRRSSNEIRMLRSCADLLGLRHENATIMIMIMFGGGGLRGGKMSPNCCDQTLPPRHVKWGKGSLRRDRRLFAPDGPEGIPVVGLPEASSGDHHGVVSR